MGKSLEAKKVRGFQTDPLSWVEAVFGDNIKKVSKIETRTGLTTQQEAGFTALGDLVRVKLKAHAGKEALTEEEKELAEKIGVSIMSGQGTGKDFFGALALMWFMMVFHTPKCLATANTAKQLRNVYWAEVAKIMRLSKPLDPSNPRSPTILEDLFVWQSERIFLKEMKGREWFCEAVTINSNAGEEDQATALAGRHEDHMLFVVDEAAGIPEPVFRPLEGTLTGKLNIVLMIFNPVRTHGFAVRSQQPGSRFVKLRWNSEESEMVSKSHVEGMEKEYGKDSNTYRIRVLGLPPLAETNVLIQWDWIEDALQRQLEPDALDPILMGVDVGGGGDKSVCCVRHGGQVFPLKRNNSRDTMQVATWAVDQMAQNEVTASFVDIIGIGRGVYDRMREFGVRVYPADSRGRARDPDRFQNLRASMYWSMREAFEQGTISIPENRDLINQLGCIKFDDEDGKIKIWKKSKLRQELEGASPDEADSLAFTFCLPERQFRLVREEDMQDEWDKGMKQEDESWMSL